jgi:methylmalonyl-CoA/ethylmalonyl-CoA epimerase
MSGDGTAVGVVVKQIAIVVRDLDATMLEYHRAFAWGPWRIYDFRHLPHHDTHVRGEFVDYSMRTAVTRVGGVDLELVEPLEGPSQYQEFLDQKGEGLHHIMCQDSDGGSTRVLAALTEQGLPVVMGGSVGTGLTYAYHDGGDGLKVLIETLEGTMVDSGLGPTGIYPPERDA